MFATFLERVTEGRKSGCAVLTPMSPAAHGPWKQLLKYGFPSWVPMQITPRAGESAVPAPSRPLPFLLLPRAGTEPSSFLPDPAGDEAASARRSLCRRTLGWATGFLPTLCPLPPPAHPPPMDRLSSATFPLLLSGSPPGFHPCTGQEQPQPLALSQEVPLQVFP